MVILPGIGLWHDGTVTINGGNINASTVYSGAGIGGYYADVAIHGGNIEATGNGELKYPLSAGIGSGKSLLIDGGVIHAYGKGGAAGRLYLQLNRGSSASVIVISPTLLSTDAPIQGPDSLVRD